MTKNQAIGIIMELIAIERQSPDDGIYAAIVQASTLNNMTVLEYRKDLLDRARILVIEHFGE